jgi:nucleotide-binding universal stress UspA family protein
MLLVKDEIYVKQVRRIMVAMDKSDSAQQSLNLALSFLQNINGGELILARIDPDTRKRGEAATDAENDPVLAPAVAEAKKRGVAYRCISRSGKPGEAICRLAEEMNTDLLILGSPDRRPSIAKTLPDLDRLLGASLSDYVRVYANCPVLLTRTAA